MRRNEGNHILAQRALKQAPFESKAGESVPNRIVVDGIRNIAEVTWLRDRFGGIFSLLAVIAPQSDRWERIEDVYVDAGLNDAHFLADDRRDRNEEVPWGQQVELCIDLADVIVYNGANRLLAEFKDKIVEFAELVSGEHVRHPIQEEILMNMAYSSRHSSKCAKRHVGAILVGVDGHVMGVGYNENPLGTNPCIEEPKYGKRCYRDIVRNRHFRNLAAQGARCPACGEALPEIEGPPWSCPKCFEQGSKTNLEEFFFPDRAMNWCTAIHAEVWAIFAAGGRAKDATMYTTTFPCFQCAEKIIQAGIAHVCFTEAYSDVAGAERLDMAGVTYSQFEGVRSSNFERIFASIQPV
jgi:deoxycytidylate deaminase